MPINGLGLPKSVATEPQKFSGSTFDFASGAPMELLGVQPGVSVIDPASVLTRLWYFNGKFLRAEGFRKDQEYVRALVALSNQATGHGLVHGFDARLSGSNTIAVDAGLALAPSGRVIHLSSGVSLSIALLISRANGTFTAGDPGEVGQPDFQLCPPDVTPQGPDEVLVGRPLYVLTAAPTEALCGEEERFGSLCEDACATETDRSVAVEGVLFRVRPITLSLPTSTAVSFTSGHFRSRVASAYFEAERNFVSSGISGAGLRSSAFWCNGAPGVGGDEVALAIFDRPGSVTNMLDMWTARREIMESSPQRHWGWRFAMRPLDVFLAQVLQFQCQLVGLGGPSGVDRVPNDDPCSEQREALAEVGEFLAGLGRKGDIREFETEESNKEKLEEIAELLAKPSQNLERLRVRVDDALLNRAKALPGSSILVDGGMVEVPSGGYLPIRAGESVEPQVRALLGAGVDIRFCAVRPDFIPEALQEAQHMERISLTQGLDDPTNLEEVDVLVPNGSVRAGSTDTTAYWGHLDLLPFRSEKVGERTQGTALTMQAVGRTHVGDSWSWTVAAQSEAPHQLDISEFANAFYGDMGRPWRETAKEADEGGVEAEAALDALIGKLHVESTVDHELYLAKTGFLQRTRHEAVMAVRSLEHLAVERLKDPAATIPRAAVLRGERRPVSMWLDIDSADLAAVVPGEKSSARIRVTGASRASTEPVLMDLQFNGTQTVVSNDVVADNFGIQTRQVVTELDGFFDSLLITGSGSFDKPPTPARGLKLVWRQRASTKGTSLTLSIVRNGQTTYRLTFGRGQREVDANLSRVGPAAPQAADLAKVWKRVETERSDGVEVSMAELRMVEQLGILEPGADGHDLGRSVITILNEALVNFERDGAFETYASARLLEPQVDHSSVGVTTDADWVMFHRRRTKICAEVVSAPTVPRTYRWYHATGQEDSGKRQLLTLLEKPKAGARQAGPARLPQLGNLGFELVDTVQFSGTGTDPLTSSARLAQAFSSSSRGDKMAFAYISDSIQLDGAVVANGRLASVTTAVSGVIDTSGVRTGIIGQVPGEFQGAGIDGAIFTFGIEAPQVATTCARIVGGGKEFWGMFHELLKKVDVLDDAILSDFIEKTAEEMQVDHVDMIARFSGEVLTNRLAIKQQIDTPDGQFEMLLTNDVQADLVERGMWQASRTSALKEALSAFQSPFIGTEQPWQSEECPALVFLLLQE